MSNPHPIRVGTEALGSVGALGSPGFVLVGHPVTQSLSPTMQDAALRALRLTATYSAFDIEPHELPECMRVLRRLAQAGRLGGANVTLPHKQNVCAFLDSLDPEAERTGAVNTIRIERSETAAGATLEIELRGFNTDVGGLVAALGEVGVDLADRAVLVIGSGGMARAAIVAAFREGASVVRVAGRNKKRCQEILDEVAHGWTGPLPHTHVGTLEEAALRFLPESRVLIQATSLGLSPEDPSPLTLERAKPDLFVFDAVYRPAETALLRQARALGLRRVNGLGLLVHQGARALVLWTGCDPPLGVMRQSVGLE